MINDYMGIISLIDDDSNIKSLTRNRQLASIPIGGRYRIIDFTLSNMVNSGVRNIGIFTNSNSRSLMDHLGSGKDWDLDRRRNGLFVFNSHDTISNRSDITLIKNNIEYLHRSHQSHVIYSYSNMICNIDYKKAIEFHEKSKSDVTLIYKNIKNGKTNFLGNQTLNLDENKKVLSIGNNVGSQDELTVYANMFIINKDVLISILSECISTGYYTTISQYISENIKKLSINAFELDCYLEKVDSIENYYKINMDMLKTKINRELFFADRTIYTKIKDAPPTKYTDISSVSNSMVANGCVIDGYVENSIISRRVIIEKGAVVKNSIIMQNCIIKENARLENVILDKNVQIEKGKELKGDSENPVVIEKRHYYTY
jgi:glucose-1-phosphate adenylyltransferase